MPINTPSGLVLNEQGYHNPPYQQFIQDVITSFNNLSVSSDFDGSYESLHNRPDLFSGDYNDLTNKPIMFSGSFNDLNNTPTTIAGYGITDAFSGSYNDLTDTPTLFSGSYGDLTDTPTLFSGSYDDLTNKPALFSGSFADLTNKPTTIAGYGITDAFSGSYNDLTDQPALFSGSFSDLTNKPTTIAGYGITDAFSGAYADLTGAPTLFSGSYNDLTDKPTLFDGDYNSLTNQPSLFSGQFADLTNKPTTISGYGITDAFSGSYNDLTNQPTLFSGDYNDLTNKPTIPSAISDITGLQSALDGKVDDSQVLTDVPAGAVFTDTTYSVGDGGLTQNNFTNALKTKLDGIEASADVTDSANVAAAGAIMDSDFTSNGLMKRTGAGTYEVDSNTYLTSVSFSDLTTTPTTIAGYGITDAFSGAYDDLTGKPTLFSGSYNDLTDTPAAYSLPLSTSTVRGGLKIGYTSSGKNYAVQLDNEQAFVNVPWTDTTYSVGDGGLTQNNFTDALKTKLDGIEAGATAGSGLPATPADGDFLVGDGTNWVQESGATARDSLSLGTGNDVNFANLQLGGDGAAASATTYKRSGNTWLTTGINTQNEAYIDAPNKFEIAAGATRQYVRLNTDGFGYNITPGAGSTQEEFTVYNANINIKNQSNDGNPYLSIGAYNLETFNIQTLYNAGAQTLAYVKFETFTESLTSNRGKYVFAVDEVDVCEIRDDNFVMNGDIELTGNITLGATSTVDGVNISAFKGDFDNLATVASSGDYNDLINKPTLFSGSYDDLTNKPTIPTDPGQALTTSSSPQFANLKLEALNPYLKFTDTDTTVYSQQEIGHLLWHSKDASLPSGDAPTAKIKIIHDNTSVAPDGRIVFQCGVNGVLSDDFEIRDDLIVSHNSVEAQKDTNNYSIFGRAVIGGTSHHNDFAWFSHLDSVGSSGNYSMLASNVGRTLINCATGQKIEFRVNNSTRWTLSSAGGIYAYNASGGDKGAGRLNADAVYDDGSLRTCYPIEYAVHGKIDLDFWDQSNPRLGIHKRARSFMSEKRYKYLDVDEYCNHWKTKEHLPSLPSKHDWKHNEMSLGELVMRLIENADMNAIHIDQLNNRIKQLENGQNKNTIN